MHERGCGGEAPEKPWGSVGTHSSLNSKSCENALQGSYNDDFVFWERDNSLGANIDVKRARLHHASESIATHDFPL